MYARIKWQDHAVTRPRTYTKVSNQDGSETLTPAPGEVLQQGTPMSATNFNRIEEGITDMETAFALLYVITQAEGRDYEARITALEASVSALT